ncbi:unnamed protein product [Blepharisma stoltei]|uniref:Cilia- and flagella-associated protein 58 central coiled coil domain-containing protein n=1 Tax=Blepharisma stoltei TaxID=1481888 RepID=A0AAU9KA21_9CILI|nr:unnamed protein product [Blepharisma stoltei]
MEPHEAQDDLESADRRMRIAEKEIEQLGITQGEFDSLENDFQTVLQDIAGDKTLERFRLEYEKLHKALKTSHETEKKLIKRCKELNSEISAHAVKVQIALKLSQEDNNAMDQVKQDVERTWKLVDQTREREETLKSRLSDLRFELAELTRRIDADETAPVEQQALLEDLKKQKDEALEVNSLRIQTLKDLRNLNAECLKKKTDLEDCKRNFLNDINEVKEGIDKANTDAETEEKRKRDMEKNLEGTKKTYEQIQDEVKNKEEQKVQINREIDNLRANIQDLKDEKQKIQDKIKTAENYNDKLTEGLRNTEETNQNLIGEAQAKETEIKRIQEELNRKQADNQRAHKEIIVMQKKIKTVTQEKTEVEYQKDFAKNKLQDLTNRNTELRRENDVDKKAIEAMMREINKMNKDCIDMEGLARLQSDEIIMKNNEFRKISNEVKASKKEIAKLKALIYQLKRDEDKYSLEASNAYSKYIQTLEQVKYKNSMISQLQRDNLDAEAKLKQQQNLYEAVRSDRNIYSKTLLESNEEIDELRRKYKILQHQITKLREEISSKNNLIREQRQSHSNLEEENKTNEQKQKRLEEKKKEKEGYIRNYENQISKLKYYIAEAEQEKMKQKKEYEMVINDRDILGTQLIKRNEELASLYEKIKIQQSTLAKGEVQYQERVIEATLLKNQIAGLKREYLIAKNQVSSTSELKKEVYRLQKDLMIVRTKIKALSEELQNPMNVHRYRKLEGTNPETYEMITKIQTLQRRLIAKTEEVAEKDFLIQEKEKLYIELKNILARQPKPAVAEQLGVYQENLKEKTKQMKNMINELNNAHAQVNRHRFEIERLNRDIAAMKEVWFDQRRKEKKLKTIEEEAEN